MSAILDELIVLREAALCEDERLRRECGATAVEIGVQCPLAKIDEIICALEEGERLLGQSLTHLQEAKRHFVVSRRWGLASLVLCGISLAITFGRLALEAIK